MDINKENIESFFVELVDNDFRITPVIEDNLVRIEIRSNKVPQISSTFIKDFFRYEDISEQVSVFVDYMKEVWGDIYVSYDYEYIYHHNGEHLDDIYDTIKYKSRSKAPSNSVELVKINIEVKKGKDGFFKRAFNKIKKFEEYNRN